MRRSKDIANALAGKYIRHFVRIIRSTRRVENIVAGRIVDGLEVKILADLVAAKVDDPARLGDQLNRANKAVKEIGTDARKAMRDAARLVAAETEKIAVADQIFTARILASQGLAVRPLPEKIIRRVMAETVLGGAPLEEWWARQAVTIQRQFGDQIRQGLRDGDSLSGLVKRVRGTRGGAGGIINEARRREAETLVRTSVQAQLNGVRKEVHRRNRKVIRATQVLTAFDAKVCPQCAAFSGGVYDEDGQPLPESLVQVPLPYGAPVFHANCRCVVVPVLDDEPAADDYTFEDWLGTQPVAVQREVLGGTRQRLWADGKLPLAQLVDQKGRPLRVSEIVREEAA